MINRLPRLYPAMQPALPCLWFLCMLLAWPAAVHGQGELGGVRVVRPVVGQALVTEAVGISFGATVVEPGLRLRFGFGTDEVFGPGGLGDSFTLTVQEDGGALTLVLVTVDAGGPVWAPPTPGTTPVDPGSLAWAPVAYPSLTPVPAHQWAYELAVALPQSAVGRPLTLYFDLFNNQDGVGSLGWFGDVTVVPEPGVWGLVGLGALLLWGRSRRSRWLPALVPVPNLNPALHPVPELESKLKSRIKIKNGVCALLLLLLCVLGPGRVSAQTEAEFTLNNVPVTLAEVTPEADVYFRSLRLNRALNVWNVEVSVSNKVGRVLSGPVVLLIDGFGGTTGVQTPDGTTTDGKGFLDLSALAGDGALSPGEVTAPRTLTLGRSGTSSPSLTTKVYAARPPVVAALGVTRSLDEAGRPLPGVALEITGPVGSGSQTSDAPSGVASFGQGPGEHLLKFSTDGYLPVWRKQTLAADRTTVLPNPRLTKRSLQTFAVTPLGGTTVSNATGTILIDFAAGAVSQSTTITLTPLTGQNLPAFLPAGWSPLNAFWLESSSPVTGTLNAQIRPLGPISSAETAALVRWNETGLQWLVVQTLAGNGTNTLAVTLTGTGAYALVVGDGAPLAPPAAQLGQALAGSTMGAIDPAGLSATGEVTPPASPASVIPEFVTGTANLVVTHATANLPSGYLLRGEVTETYLLSDGSLRLTPQYEHFIVGYQRPGDADPRTLHASFPMRPVLLFGSDQLEEATVRVDVLPEQPFDGQVLDEGGGQVGADGVRLLAGSGRLTGPSALRLRRLDATVFTNLVSAGQEVVAAFDLTVDGSTLTGTLGAQLTGAPADGLFVVARVLSEVGFYGLQPVERLQSDANGNLSSLEPLTGERLPGLRGSGQFVLVQVGAAQGLISGIARNGQGQVQLNMPVRLTGLPWLTLTDALGRFQLVAPAGEVELGVTDPLTGDTGFVSVNIPDPQTPVGQDVGTAPSGPRVAQITPAHNATRVPRVGSVVIRFNEAVNPATVIGGAIQLLKPDDSIVTAALTLNLRSTIATLSPATELEAGTTYRVRLAGTIADPGGLPLEGQAEFSFTTVPLSTRVATAQLIIYEPGATNVPSAILDDIPAFEPGDDPFAIVVHGQPGVADPEVPVILVNESTGETQTVLSKVDGSFSSFISGTEEDFVSATFVNLNGTRVYVPVSRQEFDDGFVGLYPQGGILEAQSDGGPVRVLIEPGAIETRTKIQIEPINRARLVSALETLPADGAVMLGGFSIAMEGDDLSVGADVSFPVNPADLGLPPGVAPEDTTYALTVPQELDDGTIVYEIIDEMHYENGFLVTRSPPFAGVLLRQMLRNMQSAKKLKLSNRILNALGLPGIQETVIHQLMLPIMMAAGSSIRATGTVRAADFDADGNVVPGTLRFVPGATVTYHHNGIQGVPGRLRPGTTFGTADQNGKFAFLMPADLVNGAAGFNLVATHPEYFPQVAAGGATVANLAAAAQNPVQVVDLYFLRVAGDLDLGDDLVPPQIYFSQTPRDPVPGTNALDGATITVSARDDREVSSLTLVIEDYKPLNPGITNVPPAPVIENEVETTFGAVLRQKSFRLRSPIRASAMVKASANDPAGNLRETRFPVVFVGDRIFPDPTDSAPGPRLVSSWPPDGATAVQPGQPLILRFSSALKPGLDQTPADWLNATEATITSVRFSPDRKTATCTFTASSGALVSITIQPALLGANEKEFDQDPATAGNQNHTLSLRMVPGLGGELTEIESGGGVVVSGAYAYALERAGSLNGSVVVYDLSGEAPLKVGEISVPGFPRDLALIPNYSFRLSESGECRTANLLAVAGGLIGGESFQYLWVLDLSDPASPVRLASSTVALGAVAVTKVQWSPPFVAYLESGADITSLA
jgi:hypothetical protein